jgi:hypothetical protein
MASGCYVYTPVSTTPVTGSTLAFELNDRGRVGLGQNIGPSARTIEGTLQPNGDSAYALHVLSVGYLNGQTNKWNGEQLSVSKDFVRDVRERHFSKSRTWLTAGAVTAGIVAFLASRNLLGFGAPERQPGGGEIPPESFR